MTEKSLQFYTELVLVTVLSLVAAKAWYHWFIRFLNSYIGKSVHVDFLAAIILTVIAIFGLHILFAKKDIAKKLPPPHGLFMLGKTSKSENEDR